MGHKLSSLDPALFDVQPCTPTLLEPLRNQRDAALDVLKRELLTVKLVTRRGFDLDADDIGSLIELLAVCGYCHPLTDALYSSEIHSPDNSEPVFERIHALLKEAQRLCAEVCKREKEIIYGK